MLKVGLTGGIGSGKTTVAALFATLGVPVFNADLATRQLMQTDLALREQLIAHFGAAVYPGGVLDRAYLAGIVFNNAAQLEQLNALVHPAAIGAAQAWMEQQSAPYVIKEAALLFEAGSVRDVDYVIGVSAPQALRIHRVMQREGITREQVLSRMDKQIDEGIKMRLCDAVIRNNEQELLLPQVLALHEKLKAEGERLKAKG
jgi:dephospho-CoA kinase